MAGTGVYRLCQYGIQCQGFQEGRFSGSIGACHQDTLMDVDAVCHRIRNQRMIHILRMERNMLLTARFRWAVGKFRHAVVRQELPEGCDCDQCVQFSHGGKHILNFRFAAIHIFQHGIELNHIHHKKDFQVGYHKCNGRVVLSHAYFYGGIIRKVE